MVAVSTFRKGRVRAAVSAGIMVSATLMATVPTSAATAAAADVVTMPTVAPPAEALDSDQCSPGDICVWENDDYTGEFGAYTAYGHQVAYVGDRLNDRISSIRVWYWQPWRFYEHENFQGASICVLMGRSKVNLGSFNDRISSMRWTGKDTC